MEGPDRPGLDLSIGRFLGGKAKFPEKSPAVKGPDRPGLDLSIGRFFGGKAKFPEYSSSRGEREASLIRKHDHFMPSREIEQHVRALAHNHPEGWKS